MHAWLSSSINTGSFKLIPSSRNIDDKKTASWVAEHNAMYSAAAVDNACDFRISDRSIIAPPFNIAAYHVLDSLLSMGPPQLLSQ